MLCIKSAVGYFKFILYIFAIKQKQYVSPRGWLYAKTSKKISRPLLHCNQCFRLFLKVNNSFMILGIG